MTYLEAFLRIGSFVWTGPGSFSDWLRRIAENNLRDAIRELERDKRPPPGLRLASSGDFCVALLERMDATTTAASRKLSREESLRALDAALNQLPADYERVIRLYELEELSGPEVAERMNRSHGAVRMMLGRARARLSELLGSESRFF
ncbi:MAG: sigma-70 family RNA polymerase sigma factor [Planctomycetota bacterium]